MRSAHVKIESASPYSASRKHDAPKLTKEDSGDYDARTWREHCHVNERGDVCIPSMAFKFALMQAAAYNSDKIQGKGNSTYTKHITSGVQFAEVLIPIGHKFKDIPQHSSNGKANPFCIVINAHPGGKRGDGKRVPRRYPIFDTWSCKFTVWVLDSALPNEVIERYLKDVGRFMGVGRFRPSVGGTNGRFNVVSIEWEETD